MRKLILICLCLPLCALAQEVTHIVQPNIATLRVRLLQEALTNSNTPTRPYLILEGDYIDGSDPANTLEISFDELSHDPQQYTYTVTHLNANYTPSDLMSSEYLSGFTTQDIDTYDHSLNTQQLYTHYSFTFPNEQMQITRSGHYALTIYQDGDPENIVAVAVFSVLKPVVSVAGQVTSNTIKEIAGHYQQLDLTVTFPANTRNDEYFIAVQQNNRWDNLVYAPAPSYREPNKLKWLNNASLVFEGGNEYRHFDTYSVYYAGTGVDRVRYGQGEYHAFLDTDRSRRQGVYTHAYDANGQRLVNAERTEYSDTEAEYMWVHFSLPVEAPLMDRSIYVGGDVFYNRLTSENRMSYDPDTKTYWLAALIKQGGVDYQFWEVEDRTNKITLRNTEGSYWQTENEYTVFVYYHPLGARTDELVGYQRFYSR